MSTELWLRPWARYVPQRRLLLNAGALDIPSAHSAPTYLYHPQARPAQVDGKATLTEPVAAMQGRDPSGQHDVATVLSLLPFPTRRSPGFSIATPNGACRLSWSTAPEKQSQNHEPQNDEERLAHALMQRVMAVWDRISDVEDALVDPARLWQTLAWRWAELDDQQPSRDVIVRHARELARVLDALEMGPRRILRRVHRQTPVSRVQEIDRRAMLWLARQPGETLAERAGDSQRVLAVVREENLDTLENRVMRSYAELAHRHARDYLERNRTRRRTLRARSVEAHGKRCARLARNFAERGVRKAEPGVAPNFVLQQNAHYHAIWKAWIELLDHERQKDDLWRWQARSWEEFCLLAVVVALTKVEDAQLVASSPLWFRDEHHRGRWIETDSPLAVVFLPSSGLIVEVQTEQPNEHMRTLGAPLWLRIGEAGHKQGFLSRIPVWPLWSPSNGLVHGESEEVRRILAQAGGSAVAGGLLIRPSASDDRCDFDAAGSVLCLTLGTDGAALRDALERMAEYIAALLRKRQR